MHTATGRLLIVTGIGHALVGLALFHEPLAAIVRDGIVGAIGVHLTRDGIQPSLGREAAFWFLLYGPILYLLGRVTERAVEGRDAGMLRLLGRNLLGVGVVGAAIMPVSGFWIVIALALLTLRDAGRLEAGRHGVPAASTS
jgi:hypothetical protein